MKNKEREKQIKIIKELMAEGLTNNQIELKLNCKFPRKFLSRIRGGVIFKYIETDKPMIQHEKGIKKLSEADVQNILLKIQLGEPLRAIAEEYGVSRSHISNIKLGNTWKKIRRNYNG